MIGPFVTPAYQRLNKSVILNWTNASRKRHGWWCQQWPSQSTKPKGPEESGLDIFLLIDENNVLGHIRERGTRIARPWLKTATIHADTVVFDRGKHDGSETTVIEHTNNDDDVGRRFFFVTKSHFGTSWWWSEQQQQRGWLYTGANFGVKKTSCQDTCFYHCLLCQKAMIWILYSADGAVLFYPKHCWMKTAASPRRGSSNTRSSKASLKRK